MTPDALTSSGFSVLTSIGTLFEVHHRFKEAGMYGTLPDTDINPAAQMNVELR